MWTNILVVLRAAEARFDAATWPGHGLHVGRAEDEQGTQQTLRLVELFQRSSGHMFSMCSEERYSECTGGLWRPGIGAFGVAGKLLRSGGHVIGAGSPKSEV